MRRFALMLALGVALAACRNAGSGSSPAAPASGSPPGVASTPVGVTAPAPALATATMGGQPSREPWESPTAHLATAPPAPTAVVISEQLEATDPATVQLAAGKPQLIEFFAFW